MNAQHLLSRRTEELSKSSGYTDTAAAASVWVEGNSPKANAWIGSSLPQSRLLHVSKAREGMNAHLRRIPDRVSISIKLVRA